MCAMDTPAQQAVDLADDSTVVEVLDEAPTKRARRQRLPDGVKAALYILFGIFLAAFIIGIWPLMEVLQAPPLPK